MWGKKNADGNWTGMIGLIQNQKSDLMASLLLPIEERMEILDFTVPVLISHMALLAGGSGVDDSQGVSLFRILVAFDMEVKVCLLVSMIALVGISAYAEEWPDSSIHRRWLAYKFTFYYLAILFGEATEKQPRAQVSRLLMCLWLLTAMLILNGFSGIFKSVLTVGAEESRIDSIEDLSRKRDISVMTLRATSYELMFRHPSQESFRRVAELIGKEGYTSLGEMHKPENLVKVRNGQLVLISEAMSLKSEIHKWCMETNSDGQDEGSQDGNIYFAKESIMPHYFAMGMRKNVLDVTLKRELDKRLRWMSEADLIERWLKDMFVGLERCLESGSEEDRDWALGLESGLAPVFLLWTLGIGIAASVLPTEFLKRSTFGVTKKAKCDLNVQII